MDHDLLLLDCLHRKDLMVLLCMQLVEIRRGLVKGILIRMINGKLYQALVKNFKMSLGGQIIVFLLTQCVHPFLMYYDFLNFNPLNLGKSFV